MNPETVDRLHGIALGAAIGDALGMPLEFGLASPTNQLIRNMRAGRLPAGSFTDDTEMALALAETLLASNPFDPDDLVRRFVEWYQHAPSDIGIHTSKVLSQIAKGMPWRMVTQSAYKANPFNAGNGSVMRCWPVVIAYWDQSTELIRVSQQQSEVTHAHPECVAACAFINVMMAEMIKGSPPVEASKTALEQIEIPDELHDIILLAPHRKREELRNTGWVRHTIESALWGLFTTHSFEEALIQVINLGADADTAGAVTGALAGAAYGCSAIPLDWKTALRGEWPLSSGVIWHEPDFARLTERLAKLV